ncbi:hypothetical protein KP509_24G052300 [Ceratopteris richardii]|uniref:Uncharacterized protein n=1 Tax=Ceratopteris richardii TaxID=49495 RepID=A0A8T2RX04_CERRI|nr:hypothetical protein KP509_24G052300 [Ceratopteris richardii]
MDALKSYAVVYCNQHPREYLVNKHAEYACMELVACPVPSPALNSNGSVHFTSFILVAALHHHPHCRSFMLHHVVYPYSVHLGYYSLSLPLCVYICSFLMMKS